MRACGASWGGLVLGRAGPGLLVWSCRALGPFGRILPCGGEVPGIDRGCRSRRISSFQPDGRIAASSGWWSGDAPVRGTVRASASWPGRAAPHGSTSAIGAHHVASPSLFNITAARHITGSCPITPVNAFPIRPDNVLRPRPGTHKLVPRPHTLRARAWRQTRTPSRPWRRMMFPQPQGAPTGESSAILVQCASSSRA